MFDTIPWSELSHAYGVASDLPELLETLYKGSDPNSQGNSIGALSERIIHQGTIYEATCHVVPFLIDLLKAPKGKNRDHILYLLAHIAMGSAFSYDLERETHEAVGKGCDIYFRIAENSGEDPILRHVGASLLTWFGWEPSRTSELLRQLVSESNEPKERSGLLLLLGSLGDKGPETTSLLLHMAREKSGIERSCAVAAFHLARAFPLPEIIRQLAIELVSSTEFNKHVESCQIVPYAEVSQDLLFAEFTDEDKQAWALWMIAQLEQENYKNTNTSLLVSIVFPPSHDRRPIAPSRTSPLQRRLASAIANGPRELHCQRRVDLPNSGRDWANLAKGLLPTIHIAKDSVDFTDPADISTRLNPNEITIGQRVHHSSFKFGTVEEVTVLEDEKRIEVDFGETRRTFFIRQQR